MERIFQSKSKIAVYLLFETSLLEFSLVGTNQLSSTKDWTDFFITKFLHGFHGAEFKNPYPMQEKTWIATQRCPQGAACSCSHRALLSSGKSEGSHQEQNYISFLDTGNCNVFSKYRSFAAAAITLSHNTVQVLSQRKLYLSSFTSSAWSASNPASPALPGSCHSFTALM